MVRRGAAPRGTSVPGCGPAPALGARRRPRGYAPVVTHPSRSIRVARLACVLVVFAFAIAGCGPAGATFDPSGACVADGKAPGAYPALEALVPRQFDGRAPDVVDSGRDCSERALGALVAHDVAELRFAGATWHVGAADGVTFAILSLPDTALPVGWAEEFYEVGARNARKTEHIETSRPLIDGIGPVFRLDTLNDLSYQTVVVWPDGEVARVVIVASSIVDLESKGPHDAVVARALGDASGSD